MKNAYNNIHSAFRKGVNKHLLISTWIPQWFQLSPNVFCLVSQSSPKDFWTTGAQTNFTSPLYTTSSLLGNFY